MENRIIKTFDPNKTPNYSLKQIRKFINIRRGVVQLADLGIVPSVDAVSDGQPRVGGHHTVVRSRDRNASAADQTVNIRR